MIHVIWRGKGIIVAVLAFACLVASEAITEVVTHDSLYYQHHGWPKLVAFWVAAAAVYALRHRLGVPETVEHASGPEPSLFFVPVRYWPAVLLGLGVAFFFVITD